MIDPLSEQMIDFAAAAALIPKRRGKKVHRATLYRWTMRGVRGVRLETVQVGGSRMTSREALGRFFQRLTGAQTDAAVPSRSDAKRRRAVDQAEKELAEAGW